MKLMTDLEITRVNSLATAMHNALVECARNGLTATLYNLRRFPVECCDHACRLLIIFLSENGVSNIQQISGSRPDDPNGSHLWLVVDGVTVDITAYQFSNTLEKVIVTRQSEWHSQLRQKPSDIGLPNESICDYSNRMKKNFNARFDGIYDKIANIAQCLLAK